MSLFKRIGEVLTPPPSKRSPEPPAHPASGSDEQLNEYLRKHVRSIIVAETPEHPAAIFARDEILKVAERQDPYIIAARLQMQMEALSTRLSGLDGSRYDRIYALTGELIQRHVFKEIAAIETGRSTLGPNIFSTYCSDLLGNLIEGKGIGPAIEVMIQITDRLLYDAVDTLDKRPIYLSIAEVAARCTCEQVEHAGESRHVRALWPEISPGSPTVSEATAFACGLHNQVARIRDACLEIETKPVLSKDQLKSAPSREQASQHVMYLQALLNAIRPAGYLPMKARIEIRAGMLLAPVAPDQGRKALLSAARNFEAQGDKEDALLLRKLSHDRFRRAGNLYRHCGDKASMQRIQSKIGGDTKSVDLGEGRLDSQF